MTDSGMPPVYTQDFWAKTFPRGQRGPERIHLLEHHLADVGVCFEALAAQPTIRQRLARAAGRSGLDEATAARLAVFAALHDIGKVNTGFQTQVWRDADLPPGQRRPHRLGHTLDLTPILCGEDAETADWFFEALGWEDFLAWDDRDGETVSALFVAALSHHGRPLRLEGDRQSNPRAWRSYADLNPRQFVARLGRLVRQWFPAAFGPEAPPLPAAPPFQHHFLGLCNLADWIGSNEKWFEFVDAPQDGYIAAARDKAARAIDDVGLNLTAQRRRFAGVPDFGQLFGIIRQPRAIQQKTQDIPIDEQLVIIESETGSGKTEAALWRFARMYEAGLVDGVYFALPTRAAAAQIYGRVRRFIAALFPAEDHRPPVALAVPGYEPDAAAEAMRLADYNDSWNGEHDSEKPWATENPKRYLAAQIAVGTVDQAMLGALKVRNAHLRTSCLARNLLVVDEVHASDVYMGAVLEWLLAAHTGVGGYALLMSATLGSAARRRWLRPGQRAEAQLSLPDAIATSYPAVTIPSSEGERVAGAGENGQEKIVDIAAAPEITDFAAAAQRALAAARAGAKVLVVRNTVGNAVSTQQAVEQLSAPDDTGLLFAVNGVSTLHHGRFATPDRRLLDRRVEELLGKDRQPGGCVVVGTQTLEQSLDIDADLLITDLCPADVLLQRIGRLHRHRDNPRPAGYGKPACIVLTPPDNDLSPLLSRGQNPGGLGPHGGVYHSLHVLEATLRLVAQYPQWRIPEMNRELVERATHPDALEAITQQMGVAWKNHAINNEGGYISDAQTARNAVISFGKSFYADNREILFPDIEEKVRTRLGDDRIELIFDPPQASPLGAPHPIDRMAMPSRWLGQEAPDRVTPAPGSEGFEFSIGDREFRYNRLGLHRA